MPLLARVRTALQSVLEPLFGGSGVSDGPERDEIKPLNVEITADTIDPAAADVIPVEVTVSPEAVPADVAFETDTVLGVDRAFAVEENGESVRVDSQYLGAVATPSSVMDFENPHQHGKLMEFAPDDLDFPDETVEGGEVRLGLGVFPDGLGEPIPRDHWDTDTVRIPPRGTDN